MGNFQNFIFLILLLSTTLIQCQDDSIPLEELPGKIEPCDEDTNTTNSGEKTTTSTFNGEQETTTSGGEGTTSSNEEQKFSTPSPGEQETTSSSEGTEKSTSGTQGTTSSSEGQELTTPSSGGKGTTSSSEEQGFTTPSSGGQETTSSSEGQGFTTPSSGGQETTSSTEGQELTTPSSGGQGTTSSNEGQEFTTPSSGGQGTTSSSEGQELTTPSSGGEGTTSSSEEQGFTTPSSGGQETTSSSEGQGLTTPSSGGQGTTSSGEGQELTTPSSGGQGTTSSSEGQELTTPSSGGEGTTSSSEEQGFTTPSSGGQETTSSSEGQGLTTPSSGGQGTTSSGEGQELTTPSSGGQGTTSSSEGQELTTPSSGGEGTTSSSEEQGFTTPSSGGQETNSSSEGQGLTTPSSGGQGTTSSGEGQELTTPSSGGQGTTSSSEGQELTTPSSGGEGTTSSSEEQGFTTPSSGGQETTSSSEGQGLTTPSSGGQGTTSSGEGQELTTPSSGGQGTTSSSEGQELTTPSSGGEGTTSSSEEQGFTTPSSGGQETNSSSEGQGLTTPSSGGQGTTSSGEGQELTTPSSGGEGTTSSSEGQELTTPSSGGEGTTSSSEEQGFTTPSSGGQETTSSSEGQGLTTPSSGGQGTTSSGEGQELTTPSSGGQGTTSSSEEQGFTTPSSGGQETTSSSEGQGLTTPSSGGQGTTSSGEGQELTTPSSGGQGTTSSSEEQGFTTPSSGGQETTSSSEGQGLTTPSSGGQGTTSSGEGQELTTPSSGGEGTTSSNEGQELTTPSSGGEGTTSSGEGQELTTPSSGGQGTTSSNEGQELTTPSSGGEGTTSSGEGQELTTPSSGGEGTTSSGEGQELTTPSSGGEGTTSSNEGQELTTPSSGGEGTTSSGEGQELTTPSSGGQETTSSSEGQGLTTPSSGGQGTTSSGEGQELTTPSSGGQGTTSSSEEQGFTTASSGGQGTTSSNEGQGLTTPLSGGEGTTSSNEGQEFTTPSNSEQGTTSSSEGQELTTGGQGITSTEGEAAITTGVNSTTTEEILECRNFTEYPDRFLRGYTIKQHHRSTIEDCKELCAVDDNCKAVSFYIPGKSCYLHSESKFTAAKSFWFFENYIYFHKSCNFDDVCQTMDVYEQRYFTTTNLAVKSGQTIDSCKQMCIDTKSCKSATYYKNNKYCYLFKESKDTMPNRYLINLNAVYMQRSCENETRCEGFDQHTDRYYSGNFRTYVKGVTLDVCKRICGEDNTCQSVNYYTSGKFCYINNGIAVQKPEKYKVSKGKIYLQKNCGPKNERNCTYTEYKDRKLNSFNIGFVSGKTLEDCRKLCENDVVNRCKSVSFRTSNGNCYLHYESKDTKPNNYKTATKHIYVQITCKQEERCENIIEYQSRYLASHYSNYIGQQTLESCKTLCKEDTFCKSANYYSYNKYCYLNYETKDTKPNYYRAYNRITYLHKDCNEEKNCTELIEYQDRYFSGYRISTLGQQTLNSCKEMCAKDKECKAATFYIPSKYCYLHRESKSTKPNNLWYYKNYVYMHKSCDKEEVCENMDEFENRYISGNLIAYIGRQTIDSCKKLCTDDQKCKSATYYNNNKYCYLHKESKNTVPENNYLLSVNTVYLHKSCENETRCEEFDEYPNRYFQGTYGRYLNGQTLESCKKICGEDNTCQSANFDKNRKTCYINRELISEKPNKFLISTSYVFLKKNCGPKPKHNCTFTNFSNRLLNSYNIGSIAGQTLESCKKTCEDDLANRCKSVSILKRSGHCYFHYESKDTKPNNYKTSNGYNYLHKTCEEEDACKQLVEYPDRYLTSFYSNYISQQTLESCKNICRDDTLCKSANYYSYNKYCYLNYETKDTKPNYFKAYNKIIYLHKTCEPNNACMNFTLYSQRRLNGYYWTYIGQQTQEKCQKMCGLDETCKAASFNSRNNYCYLHKESKSTKPRSYITATGWTYLHKQCEDVEQNQCEFVRFPTRYLVSNDRSTLARQTEESCVKACREDDVYNCSSVDFNTANKYCYLNKGNKDTKPASFRYADGWVYYQRLCKKENITSCTRYDAYPKRTITAYTLATATKYTIEMCANLCNRDVKCLSFDFVNKTKTCYLKSESKDTKYNYFKANINYIHYHKNCEEETKCTDIQESPSRYMNAYIHTSVVTDSLEECKQLCAQDRNCSAGYFVKSSKSCSISLYNKYDKPAYWKLAAGYIYIHKNCSVQPKEDCKFDEYPRRYLRGYDSGSVKVESKDDCWKICEQDDIKHCKAADFNGNNNMCYLNSGTKDTYKTAFLIANKWSYFQKNCGEKQGCGQFETFPMRYLNGFDQASISGITKEECEKMCAPDKNCLSFDYNIPSKYCYLNLETKDTKYSSYIANKNFEYNHKICKNETRCEQFETFKNRYLYLNDLTNVVTSTADQCQQLCAKDKKCPSVDYYIPSKTCYINLKSKETARKSYLANTNYIYLHKSCKNEERCEKILEYENRYLNGFQLTNVGKQTLESCKQMCIKDKDCKSADFNTANKYCYIRTETKDSKPTSYLASSSYIHLENNCEVEESKRMNGYSRTNLLVKDFEECKKLCAEDKNCPAAGFNNANKYCYLYYETRYTKPSAYIITASWEYIHKNCNETVKDNCTSERHLTRYLRGNDITYVAGQTEESCRKLCEEDDVTHCKSADYNSNNKYCYLNKETKESKSSDYLYANGYVYLERTCKPSVYPGCKKYDSYPRRYITAYNIVSATKYTLAMCMDLCNKDEKCLSFDFYNKTMTCNIKSESKDTKYSYFKTDANSVHYHKNCEAETKCTDIQESPSRYLSAYIHASVVTDSLEECKELCAQDRNCSAGYFVKSSKSCSISLFNKYDKPAYWKLAAGYIYIHKNCSVQPKDDCKFDEYPRRYLRGYDSESVKVESKDECWKICEQDDNKHCQAADFNGNNNMCYLNSGTKDTYKTAFLIANKWSYFQKNCGEKQGCGQFETFPMRYLNGFDQSSISGITKDQCLDMCAQDKNCLSFDYNIPSKYCYLNLETKDTKYSSYIANKNFEYNHKICKNETRCEQFETFKNRYLYLNDLTNVVTSTADQCQQLCAKDKKCPSVDYYIPSKTCYINLKSKETARKSYLANTNYIYLHKSCKNEERCEKILEYENRYLNGFQLTNVGKQTLESCKQMCIKDKDCKSADFNTANKYCYIRTETKDSKPTSYLASSSYIHLENNCEVEERCEKFQHFTQRRMNGYSRTNLLVKDFEECKKLCAEDKNCPAAGFNNANKYCYLYYETRYTKPSAYIITAGWEYIHKNCNETVKDNCTSERHLTRYLRGNDITHVAGQTEESCRKLCEDDDVTHCKSADYNSNNKYCYLNKETKESKSSDYLYANGYVYLERTCKPSVYPGCKKYDSYPRRYITAYNIVSATKYTLAMCMDLCNKDEKCLSLDFYNKTMTCNIKSESKDTKYSYFKTDANSVHYHKNCEAETKCTDIQESPSRYLSAYIHASVVTDSLEECKELCAQDRNCSAGYFVKSSKSCSISLFNKYDKPAYWKLAAGYIYIHKNCSVQPKEDCKFDEYPKRYLTGYDSESVKVESKDECWKICEQDDIKYCKAADFNGNNNMCYLNSGTKDTYKTSFLIANKWSYFQKNCGEKKGCEQFETFPMRYLNGFDQASISGISKEECEEMCAKDKNCLSFDFYIPSKYCYLSLETKDTKYTSYLSSNNYEYNQKLCKNETRCEKFERFNNRYLNGNDLTSIVTGTVEKCQELCAEDKSCSSADFYIPSKTCYLNLKSKNTARTSYLANTNYIYLHKTCENEERCDKIFEYEHRYLNGFELTNVGKQTLESCKQMCIKDKDCKAAGFNNGNKYCYLYYETRHTKPSSYIITAGWEYIHKNCNQTVKDNCTSERHLTRYLRGNDITYVAGQTEESCRKLCEDDDVTNCKSADYNSNNKYCYLNKETKESKSSDYLYANGYVYLERTCKPSVYPGCKKYDSYPRRYITAYNIVSATKYTLAMCMDLCNKDEKCLSFDFYNKTMTCNIKSESKDTKYSYFKTDANSVHYHKNCEAETKCTDIQESPSRYLSAYIHASVVTDSLEECKELCAQDRNCSAGYFVKSSKSCSISLFNKYDKPAYWKLAAGYIYIHKNCSVQPKEDCKFDEYPRRYLNGYDSESLRVESKEACWKLCEEDDIKHCKAADFNGNNNMCYLNSGTKDTYKTSFLIANKWSYFQKNCGEKKGCEEFETFPSRYLNGLDQASISSVSKEECQEMCAIDKNCLSFDYNLPSKYCYLSLETKDTKYNSYLSSNNFEYNQKLCKNETRCEKFERFNNRYLTGNDLTSIVMETVEKCQEFCAKDKSCPSADFYIPSKTCYINLKSKNTARTSYLANTNYIYLHKTCENEERCDKIFEYEHRYLNGFELTNVGKQTLES
ncbi:DgyrCDS3288, partial [Dimorphilus gyrociliatus]